MKRLLFAALAITALYACTDIKENVESVAGVETHLVFTARSEGFDPGTKTVRMDDGSTWWNASEEISVFYGNGSGGGSKFTSLNTKLQEIVEFDGSIETSDSGNYFWAVYPYSLNNACDGTSITTVIPAYQTASEGNFSGDAFPTLAKSNTLDLAFWNICGGIKFFVSRSDIKSVTFKGNGDEVLAGKVRVTFNADGKPEVAEVLDGKTEVTLNAPDGGTFKADKSYYLTLLPTALDGGFTMSFNTATEQGTLVSNKSQIVKRSIFGVLKNIDLKVSEWGQTWVEPEWVDLGLPSGLKWATFNVGAAKPEDYGDYFAWGEIEPKDYYGDKTYKWHKESSNILTKYNYTSLYGIVDNRTVLDLDDDAARACWGGYWRIPTYAEWEELRNCCYLVWTNDYNSTGVAGCVLRSVMEGFTEKSIFLPAAGFWYFSHFYNDGLGGRYWTSSLDKGFPYQALIYHIYTNNGDGSQNMFGYDRALGLSIRPVYDYRTHPESILLYPPNISLNVGDSQQLIATISPPDAIDRSIMWSSDNAAVATVDNAGIVTALSPGTATITVTTNDGGLTASCTVTVKIYVLEAVDLGLSVKWASFNVGATKPEEIGDYFAWGEIEPKENYNWSTYKWCNGSSITFTRYCSVDLTSYWGGSGSPDGKTEFKDYDYEDDAARANWGDVWRTPSFLEWMELEENCTWTWIQNYNDTHISGIRATSTIVGYTDKSIFLPAAGEIDDSYISTIGGGRYWSSSVGWTPGDPYYFDFDYSHCGVSYGGNRRCYGFPVRAVYDDKIHPESLLLNKSSLSLSVGGSEQLIATILPTNCTDTKVCWFSGNTRVATVDDNGKVTAMASGNAIITATTRDGGVLASCTIMVDNPNILLQEAVDLGLSVKWASWNIGASTPEEYGDYFAWGETEPKRDYSWSTYKWCNGADYKLTKYCTQSPYWDSSEPMDNKTILDLEDDAAHVNWGGSWRMPTHEEWTELRNMCAWTWTTMNGVNGIIVTGRSGNSILFLPAAGRWNSTNFYTGSWSYYWSSSLGTNDPVFVYGPGFSSDYFTYNYCISRFCGLPVRPVCPKD